MSYRNATVKTETALLEQIISSREVGICFTDADGHFVKIMDGDLALRDALIDYQRERIRELTLSERTSTKTPKPVSYPVRED